MNKYKYLEKIALNKCLLVITNQGSLHFKKLIKFPDGNLYIRLINVFPNQRS